MRPILSLALGLAGLPFVVAAAGFAMANNGSAAAVALGGAGVLALVSGWNGVATFRLRDSGPVHNAAALIGLALALGVAVTALVFALSFHW
jgi:hypothetical protein